MYTRISDQTIIDKLTVPLQIVDRDTYNTNRTILQNHYDVYEFNEWHKHIKEMLNSIYQLADLNTLGLFPVNIKALRKLVETGDNLLSVLMDLKNYGSNHWFYTMFGTLNEGVTGTNISRHAIPKFTEFLQLMQTALRPNSSTPTENRLALDNLSTKAAEMSAALTMSLSEKICRAIALFVGAAMAAMGTFILIISPSGGPSTPALIGLGIASINVGTLLAINPVRLFFGRYPKKIMDLSNTIHIIKVQDGLGVIQEHCLRQANSANS